ncbi:MAG: iron-sulfur cluster assembly accessory protein [Rhodobacterales bacterium]|nr:iron-sulfur cluster assembly accessory protein [Rhodobacterales bacterium]
MLDLTDRAQAAINRFTQSAETPVGGLRISVVDGGCSGLQYALSLESSPRDGDSVLACGATTVFVAAASVPVLSGTTIDFVESVEGSGFTFSNPNAVRTCACGHSFAACS